MITYFHTNLAQHVKGKYSETESIIKRPSSKGTGPPGEQGMIGILEKEW